MQYDMSYVYNSNDPKTTPSPHRELNSSLRAYYKLARRPQGFITIHDLRSVLGINGVYAHELICDRLDAMSALGYISYNRIEGSNRMVYRIIVNPLNEVLPELPNIQQSFRDSDTLPARKLLRRFWELQREELGHSETPSPKLYAMANKVLEKVDYDAAYGAAQEYWLMSSDNRRGSNFQEFVYRLEEMVNRSLDDKREKRMQAKLKRKRERQHDPRKWLEEIIAHPANDADKAWAEKELAKLDGE